MVSVICKDKKIPFIIYYNGNLQCLKNIISWCNTINIMPCKVFILSKIDISISEVKTIKVQTRPKISNLHVISKTNYYFYTDDIIDLSKSPIDLLKHCVLKLKDGYDVIKISSDTDYLDFNCVRNLQIKNEIYETKFPYVISTKQIQTQITEPIKHINEQMKTNNILYIVGKTYKCKLKNRENITLTFDSMQICRDQFDNYANVTCVNGYLILNWKSGKYTTSSIYSKYNNFNNIIGTFDNKYDFIGHIHNKNDNLKTLDKIKNSNIIRQPINQNIKVSRKIFLVVCAYNINDNVVNDFINMNDPVLSRYDKLELCIVSNKPIANINKYKYIRNYILKDSIFSLSKYTNYGISKCLAEDNDIIIKTDIDIKYSNSLLNSLLTTVTHSNAVISLCAYEDNRNVNMNDINYWNSKKKLMNGFGACFAMTKKDWVLTSGYDERMFGWGGEDEDMLRRARMKIKCHIKTMFSLYHINHPSRINDTYFPHKSSDNMKICSTSDWNKNMILKHKININNDIKLSDLFDLEKTAIVGNAGSLLDKKQGRLIDSYDTVIRFNNYKIMPAYSGVKENIWVTSCCSDIKERSHKYDHYISPFPYQTYNRNLNILHHYKFKFIPDYIIAECKKEVKNPSTGLMFLYWIYQDFGNIIPDNIFGFSFFKGTHHYFDKYDACCHDKQLEFDFAKKLYNMQIKFITQ